MGGLVVCRGAIGSLLLLRFLRRAYRIDQFTRSRDGLGLGPTLSPTLRPQCLMRWKPFGKTWMRNRRMNSPGLSVMLFVAAGSLDPDSLCS